MSNHTCGTCNEPILDGQGRYHPTHRLGPKSPHFHTECAETDPRDVWIAEHEAQICKMHRAGQRVTFYAEKIIGGLRFDTGEYVIRRIGPMIDEPTF
jgi:hypothetical protein